MGIDLRIVKRLAADVLDCGKNRVCLKPEFTQQLKNATSRSYVRRLIKKHIIVRKDVKGQSRSRCREKTEAKRRGRHMGLGKRKGSKNARTCQKTAWIVRQRVLRRTLKKLREQGKLDKNTYHLFYLKAKGNQFKNKRVLFEAIWEAKNIKNKEKFLVEQRDARKARAFARKNRKNNKIETTD